MRKAVLSLTNAANWYQRNGYYNLAASHGSIYDGRSISPEDALKVTAYFGCVRIISEDVASLPLFTYRRRGASTEKAPEHTLYERLHNAANPETNAMSFREAMTSHALMTGDGYALIERAARDSERIIGLYNVQPGEVRKDRDSRRQLVYIYKRGNEQEKTLDGSKMLNLQGFSFDGVTGVNVTRLARNTLGLAVEQNDYARSFFQRDTTPGIVVKVPQKLEESGVAKVKAAWRELVRAHDVAVAHSGMEVESLGKTNAESQLIEQRVFQILEVCRLFRMPPHKVSELSRATFSNIEQQSIDYYTNTLRPWLVRWEQTINRVCLYNQPQYFVEHSIEGLLRGDFTTQTNGFAKLLEKGVYSINEVRGLLNLNPIEGGDEHFIQLNMQNVLNAGEEPGALTAAEQPEPAKARLVRVKSANLN